MCAAKLSKSIRKIVFHSFRIICISSIARRFRCSILGGRGILFLALRKLLLFYYHISGVNLLPITVGIAACLDMSKNNQLCTLPAVLLSKLAQLAECNTIDEISRCFPFPLSSAVYRQ